MYLSNNDSLSSSGGITPPGNVPTTCVSNCKTPLPVIKDSLGNPVNIGDFWTEQGGYYSGLFTLTGKEVYALIISPKAVGHIYNKQHATVDNTTTRLIFAYTRSLVDGKKNTEDVINYIITTNRQSLYPLWAEIIYKKNQSVGGFSDWYLPSTEETLLMLKYFHPDGLSCTWDCNRYNSYIGKNLYPCGHCSTSSFVITQFNDFKYGGTESLKSTTSSYHFLTTSSANMSSSYQELTFYIFNNTTYRNYWSTSGYTLNFPAIMESRLVRRVLVS